MLNLPRPTLIGMIHLPALPGSPAHMFPMEEIIERALADAHTLQGAGFNALMIENFGDAPFAADQLSSASLAAMAVVADRVRTAVALPIGVNALRNDALAALGIAVAVGASFVRVNVHTGVTATDQGMLTGRADETLRYRKLLGARVAILADVHVKHGRSISEPDIASAARDTAYRGLADGLVVTGSATGVGVDPQDLRRVRSAVPDRRIFVGSGATPSTIASLLHSADGVIVGSGLKPESDPSRPIDAALAAEFVRSARGG